MISDRLNVFWKNPATIEDIEVFEDRNQCSLPNDYKEFLLTSNGAIIFKSQYEDDGKITKVQYKNFIKNNTW